MDTKCAYLIKNHREAYFSVFVAPSAFILFLRVLCTSVFAVCILGSCLSSEQEDIVAESPIDAESAATQAILGDKIADWQEAFPKQVKSFQSSTIEEPSPSGFGGSVPVQRLELYPELKMIFSGIAFSKDYKEDRGHAWAWNDLYETERTSGSTTASCLTCKTGEIAGIYSKYGWDYATLTLDDFPQETHEGISCISCHDPETKKLRLSQPAFIEAITESGVDLASLSEDDLSELTCAQCHSEYYFKPGNKRVVQPLSRGTSAEAMWDYYETKPNGFEFDFINPISGAKLLKAQHPDYEDWVEGTHAAAGASCADCHMPKLTAEDGSRYSSHRITSPLHTIEASCMGCHTDVSPDFLTARTRYNQATLESLLRLTGQHLETSHRLIGSAAKKGLSSKTLGKARDTIRRAQWMFDYVASANSMGAHNITGAMSDLSQALNYSAEARDILNGIF